MADAGAGINLGWFDHHEEQAKRHPHLMEDFTVFKGTHFDKLEVGGVGGEDYGTDVMATITYKIPYIVKGRHATIIIGLSRKAICKTLVGMPFFVGAKVSYAVAKGIMSSAVFGVSFQV